MGKDKIDIKVDSICMISALVLVILALITDNIFFELICIVNVVMLTNLPAGNAMKKNIKTVQACYILLCILLSLVLLLTNNLLLLIIYAISVAVILFLS